jgi:hypothetical protein
MTNPFRSRTTRLAILIGGLLLLYVVGVIVRKQYGIGVVVRNESGETLRQVSLKVESIGDRGKRYNLRDLTSGGYVRVYAQPVTESHINLEFMDARNKLHTETVVGYVEAGYCGIANATILPGDKINTISDPACWKSWFDFI